MKIKLTIKNIEAMPVPQGKEVVLWDTEIKGLGVRWQSEKGEKVFFLQYRIDHKVKKYTIGIFKKEITPETAREKARQILHDKTIGIDAQEEKMNKRKEPTVSEIWELYEKSCDLKKRSIDTFRSYAKNHILPNIGSKKFRDLKKHHIADMLSKWEANRSTFRMIIALISILEGYAIDIGLIEKRDYDWRGIKIEKAKSRERYLTREEIDALLRVMESTRPLYHNCKAIIELLFLTGRRIDEIRRLKWSEVDLNRGIARLSDSKTGATNVYLSQEAIEIIKKQEKLKNNDYIFWGDSRDGTVSYVKVSKYFRKCVEDAKIDNVRIHDIRHTFASIAVMSGVSLFAVSKILGHKSTDMTKTYAHMAPDGVREIACQVAGNILKKHRDQ